MTKNEFQLQHISLRVGRKLSEG